MRKLSCFLLVMVVLIAGCNRHMTGTNATKPSADEVKAVKAKTPSPAPSRYIHGQIISDGIMMAVSNAGRVSITSDAVVVVQLDNGEVLQTAIEGQKPEVIKSYIDGFDRGETLRYIKTKDGWQLTTRI